MSCGLFMVRINYNVSCILSVNLNFQMHASVKTKSGIIAPWLHLNSCDMKYRTVILKYM